ncbi:MULTISPECIES: dermonecrotic toxin domain-containing protein [Pseudomonas]|uniref:dermonecrotic toxin domain-containing protein n=1 Tax=Pseudomonas TaxID=286 RepID=UPI00159704C9|nr:MULTISPECIES: DUF6543 domain-containing protein [Pseudomonas]
MSATLTLKILVARQFADRPTLHQVLDTNALKILLTHCPQIGDLDSLARLFLIREYPPTTPVNLADLLLESFMKGEPLALSGTDQLALSTSADAPGKYPLGAGVAESLNADLSILLNGLIQTFEDAQVSFWNAMASGLDVSRLRWMEQVLKIALMVCIEEQGLEAHEKKSLYAAVDNGLVRSQAYALRVNLLHEGLGTELKLADWLLIDNSSTVATYLWCKPCGIVHGFKSEEELGRALQAAMADHHDFDELTWSHHPLSVDPFEFQALQLLTGNIEDVERLELGSFERAEQLQEQLHHFSDPARHFSDLVPIDEQRGESLMPGWVRQASHQHQYDYGRLLTEWVVAQTNSHYLLGSPHVESLEQYAIRRLREQMHVDLPQQAAIDPNLLMITVESNETTVPLEDAFSDAPILPATPAISTRDTSLAQLAIFRLDVDKGELTTQVHDRGSDQPLPDGLTLAYLDSLIEKVDIGGNYPRYLKQQLDLAATHPGWLQGCARAWRKSLLLNAFKGVTTSQLSAAAFNTIASFCNAPEAQGHQISIAPLAFQTGPEPNNQDVVAGMFVLQLPSLGRWLLYRPWQQDDALLEFDAFRGILEKLIQDEKLQTNILSWMDEDASTLHTIKGLAHPHLKSFLESALDFLNPERILLIDLQPQPQMIFAPFQGELDHHLYQSWILYLSRLSMAQSPSNAKLRLEEWRLIAWAVFDVTSMFAYGWVGDMVVLINALRTLDGDLPALTEGNDTQKAGAFVDLLYNTIMVSMHSAGKLHETPAAKGITFTDNVSLVRNKRAIFNELTPGAELGSTTSETSLPADEPHGQAEALQVRINQHEQKLKSIEDAIERREKALPPDHGDATPLHPEPDALAPHVFLQVKKLAQLVAALKQGTQGRMRASRYFAVNLKKLGYYRAQLNGANESYLNLTRGRLTEIHAPDGPGASVEDYAHYQSALKNNIKLRLKLLESLALFEDDPLAHPAKSTPKQRLFEQGMTELTVLGDVNEELEQLSILPPITIRDVPERPLSSRFDEVLATQKAIESSPESFSEVERAEKLGEALDTFTASIARVEYAMKDPDPWLDSKGLGELLNYLKKLKRLTLTQLDQATRVQPSNDTGTTKPPSANTAPAEQGKATPAPAFLGKARIKHINQMLMNADQAFSKYAKDYGSQPSTLANLMDDYIEGLKRAAGDVAAAASPPEGLERKLKMAIIQLQERSLALQIEARMKSAHPDVESLRYLLAHDKVYLRAGTTNKRLQRADDFLDVYTIHQRSNGNKLPWEAHFHYGRDVKDPLDFSAGHLKSGNSPSYRMMNARAIGASQRVDVSRAVLKRATAKQLIPFPTQRTLA